MADIIVAAPGQAGGAGSRIALFLTKFAGEVIAALERSTVAMDKFMVRTIENGKSASFPVMGRTTAAYLKPGGNLDDLRQNIIHAEKLIVIDGLLTADCLIIDIDDAMVHYDIRGEYSRQLGEALAVAADGAILAEIAKLVVADAENIAGLGKGDLTSRTLVSGQTVGINEPTGLAIVDVLLDIGTKMSVNRVPKTERYAFVTPAYHAAIVRSLVAINRDYGGLGNIADGNVLRVAGFDVIECPHLTDGGASTTNILQGAGHVFPSAYAPAGTTPIGIIAAHRSAVGTVKLMDLALEHARRPELQADQVIAKYAMGHGGLRPEAAFVGRVVNPT